MSAAEHERYPSLPAELKKSPARGEDLVLERWRRDDTFGAVQRARADAPPFVFYEGPPTANGRPGIHHVLSRTLKDTICRYQTMRGRRVDRKAGWDTHGLPVELEVEKALGISGKPQIEEHGVAAFNTRCRESVWKYRDDWERLSERIGYWLDYEHPYVTYEAQYVDSLWYLLARFQKEGLVYRGKRVLPYCGRCGTGLSSHELGQPGVYRDVLDPSVTLRFRLAEAPDGPESILAWTTTPWTLPSNFALAVHPDCEYVRARVSAPVEKGAEPGSAGHEIVWVVAERAEAVLGKEFEELGRHPGRDLIGRRYEPLFAPMEGHHLEPVPDGGDELRANMHTVVSGDFVTVEDGTGIVHQAPYGADDWETAKTHRILTILGVGPNGRFLQDVRAPGSNAAAVEEGTFFKDADKLVRRDLRERGLLFHDAQETHSYPHCWRCDTPLYYFPADAWYVRTTEMKERMLAYNRQIRWLPPEVGEKRFGEWLENNVDWNLSRDRYWGTPLPFWVCAQDHVTAVESLADLERLAGAPVEADEEWQKRHKPWVDDVTFACPDCGERAVRTKQVADVWFDSGAMPYAQQGWPHVEGSAERLRDQFPADYICEGLDQTRGWFYTLHAIAAFVTNLPDAGLPAGPAYRACLVNGLVLDKDGVKMSKRLGNIVDPWQVIEEHGVDALRWYQVSGGAPWLPKRFDAKGILDARQRFFDKLANTYGFFREYARLDGYAREAADVPAVAQRPPIDRWLASRTQTLARDVQAAYDAFDLTAVTRLLDGYVVDELSNWYVRRNRRRFWKSEAGPDKLAAYATLEDALRTVTLLAAPIAPFVCELLWERLEPSDGSVHAQLVPEVAAELVDPELERGVELVQSVVVMGRALRDRCGHRVRQPLRAIHVRSGDPRDLELLAGEFATAEVLDELNIKSWGSLEADDGRLVALRAKANFKGLGKRLGKRMKAAAAAISALGTEDLQRLRSGGAVALEIEGGGVEIGPEDVEIQVESRAEFDVETDGRLIVWLETELDEGLVLEGLAREVVNRVNGLRKDSGLAVEQRIRLFLGSGDSAEVSESLARHRGLIADETLTLELDVATGKPAGEGVASWDLGEGRQLFARLEPA